MGRITETVAYLNSTTNDWQKGKIKLSDFKHIEITEELKAARKLNLKNDIL